MKRSARRRAEEVEFLPAALEIQESPPSPVGRALAVAIGGVLVAGVVWAGLGEVDIVAVAPGRVAPRDHSKVVQPLEAGIIRSIRVWDGKSVRRGEVVIELDPTSSGAEERRVTTERLAALTHVARLRALLAGEAAFEPPSGVDPALLKLQHRLLRDQLVEYRGRLDAANLLVQQRAAALQATRATIQRLDALVRLETQRAEAYRRLVEREYIARIQHLEAEQKRVDAVQELAVQRQRLDQDMAALAESEKQAELVASEWSRARLAELTDWETKTASLSEEVVKAVRRNAVQRLVAPVDGIVQQLAVHTVGGVVAPAQQLMVVVPQAPELEVEAWVENKDIGFVGPGQTVEIKVETFPYTRYGTVTGKIVTLSTDAVPVDKLGLVYAARIRLDRPTLDRSGEEARSLAPGMAVSAEIKIGTRRLLEYFLDPVLRRGREALRER